MTVRDSPLPEAQLQAISHGVSELTGLNLDPEHGPAAQRLIDDPHWPCEQARVEALALQLSVGETYFFREPAAFELIERELLPPLIEQRRRSTRRLRLWSAGCCTGEEAYSLAIVLNRLIPDMASWDILIQGTDIHPGFLAHAEGGIYGDWSFRGMASASRQEGFEALDEERWAVRPALRRLARFRFGNLARDETAGEAFDLILCRHVLMYFEPQQAQRALHRLQAALVDGGWLLVAAAETHAVAHRSLAPLRCGDTVVHRKGGVRPELTRPRARSEAVCLADDAVARCRWAVAADKCNPGLHYRHAQLLELAGRLDDARAALRRALFLDPQLSAAYTALARLSARQGRRADAARHRLHAHGPARRTAR